MARIGIINLGAAPPRMRIAAPSGDVNDESTLIFSEEWLSGQIVSTGMVTNPKVDDYAAMKITVPIIDQGFVPVVLYWATSNAGEFVYPGPMVRLKNVWPTPETEFGISVAQTSITVMFHKNSQTYNSWAQSVRYIVLRMPR